MKVAIVHNDRVTTQVAVRHLQVLLAEKGILQDQQHPDLVISVGGDGTLISAFHKYKQQLDKVCFAGIHTGHLGFYTDWRNYDMEKLVDALASHPVEENEVGYPLLEMKVTTSCGEKRFLALNEASIKRISKTMEAEVWLGGERFENFRGDGLCVSTPTGSTAYSKSLGGAVIHPRLKTLQLTEIASINNLVFRTVGSPIVIAPDEWITIVPKISDRSVVIVDGERISLTDVQKVDYKIAAEEIRFYQYGHHHFWERVNDAFIGDR